jgi:hypothetical protein
VTPTERGVHALSRRLPAMLTAAGVVVAALAIGVPWPTARAAAPTAATVTITSLDPLVPTAAGTLRLAGQVTNSGSASVDDVQIRLRIATTPVLGRSDITSVATGASNVQGQLVNLTLPDAPRHLDPGGPANWSIGVPLIDLPIGGVGVYILVVEAVGTLNGTYQQLGVERTFLPWVPKPSEVQPSRLVWLWPLSEAPGSAPDGVLLSDQIATDLGPTGRLTQLVAIGGTAQGVVSWVADPQVLESVAGLSGGYRYISGSGVREGRGATAAAAWLSAADLALAAGDVHSLPYALPDADALVRANLDHDLVATLTLGQQLLSARIGRDSGPPVYWPTSGISERRTFDVLDSAGVKTVVLSSNTLPTAASQPFTSTGLMDLPTVGGSLQAVLSDPGLAAALAMPTDSPAEVLAARQRFAADTAMVTFEDPGNPRTVVVAPPINWSPDPALLRQLLAMVANNPWITPMTLTELLTHQADTNPRSRVEYSASDRAAELSPGILSTLTQDHRQLDALGSALSNPTKITQPFTTAILRGESAWWRFDPGAGAELSVRVTRQLAAVVSGVRIVSRGTITLSGVKGDVPLTIANDFDQPVTVGVVLLSNPAPRLHASKVSPVTVPPHRKISLEIPATLAGSAPLSVAAQLVTVAGEDLGAPVRLSLRSTAYARAAKYVVLGAFAALVMFLAANFVRRWRGGTPR